MSFTIRPYRRGGWEVDIVITYPNGEKHRERRKAPVDSKSAAKRWAKERELFLLQLGRPPRRGENIDTPPEEVPTVPTFAEFVPRYLEYVKANRQKPSTRKAKQTICRCHLIPVFGHLRLNEIGPADVERLKARHANHSAKTLNNALSIFNSILACAVALGVLEASPVRARWVKTTLPSMPFYDFDEFERLCASARRLSEQHELIVLLGGCAGLRCGEIRALRWSSIDFARGFLTVERAYSLDEVLVPKGNKIRMEIGSLPTPIDQLERTLLKLQMEEQALVHESDKASKARLIETKREIAEFKEQRDAMRAQWMNEKEIIGQLRDLSPKVEELRLESERAKRRGELGKAAEIEYGRIPEVEKEIARLGARARDNKLTLEELSGGTFTISNGGVYGSMLSTPILNPPQSGILGLHNIVERPVAVNGAVEIRPIMYLALSYDHRLVDGREAVQFLVHIKDRIEAPERLMLEV